MARSTRCPKCDGSMTIGVIIHKDKQSYLWRMSSWLEGPIVKYPAWLSGAVKRQGKKPIDIETWRCNRCYYLESYAPDSTS